METIPVDHKRLLKIKHSEDEDEEIDVMGDDVMEEIFRLRDEHYENGTLQDFGIEPYEADPAVEINTTVAEDEETISIRPSPHKRNGASNLEMFKMRGKFSIEENELVNHLGKYPKSTNKFPCSLCGIKFSMDFGHDYHEFDICLKIGEINEKFKCGVCGVDFYIEQNLYRAKFQNSQTKRSGRGFWRRRFGRRC